MMAQTNPSSALWILTGIVVSANSHNQPLLNRAPSNFECNSDKEIIVSAAASLSSSFKEIGHKFEQANPGTKVRFNFGGSGVLKSQIQLGAPVEVFASASETEPDALIAGGILDKRSRSEFASNSLVLICLKSKLTRTWNDLTTSKVMRIAISNPNSVPSGRYAREALQHKSIWDKVRGKLILGRDVKQTLTYVLNGDVDAGLVFRTDTADNMDRLKIVSTAQSGIDHSPIRYVAASSPNSMEGRSFVQFLRTRVSQSIFKKYGFATVSSLPAHNSKRK